MFNTKNQELENKTWTMADFLSNGEDIDVESTTETEKLEDTAEEEIETKTKSKTKTKKKRKTKRKSKSKAKTKSKSKTKTKTKTKRKTKSKTVIAPSVQRDFNVSIMVASGEEAKVACGDGQIKSFSSQTSITFARPEQCAIQVGGATGVLKADKKKTIRCTISGNSVRCK